MIVCVACHTVFHSILLRKRAKSYLNDSFRNQVQLIRDPRLQVEMVGVPEEHLLGHAFHMYHLTSPDGT